MYVGSVYIPFWSIVTVVIVVFAVVRVATISWLLRKNNKENQSPISFPAVGSKFDFPGTCPALLQIDSVNTDEGTAEATLLILLPAGSKLGIIDDEPDNFNGYSVRFTDDKGGGGIYNWDWDKCTEPKELGRIRWAPNNMCVLPG